MRLTVVMDATTGDLLGAGEVPPGTEVAEGWTVNWVVGGSLEFTRSDNVIGKDNGMALEASAFTEADVQYQDSDHLAIGRLNVELGGRIELPDRPFVPSTDRTDLEMSYTYRVVPWFGPSVWSTFSTQLLPGVIVFDERTDVIKLRSDGTQVSTLTDVLDVEVSRPLSPIFLRFGTGPRFDLAPAFWVSFSSRFGVGSRLVFTPDLYGSADDPNTPEFELREIDDVTQFGLEASLTGQLNITRWVQLKLETDVFAPFDDINRPVVGFLATVALRLASFASLNYTVRIDDDRSLAPETQIDQSVLLRFAYKIF
jgi:hypothetical protein